MLQTEEELVDDAAESVLMKRIKNNDEQTARWWLARRRRQKYGDSVDVTSGGELLLKDITDVISKLLPDTTKS